MRVLVTGGVGYVGSHTVVALHEAGHEVVVVDNFSNCSRRTADALRSLTTADLAVVEADACDRGMLDALFAEQRFDAVVHFAALKAVSESVEKPLDYYRNNLMSTIALAQTMAAHGVARIVFSSSCTVYGEPQTVPVTEATPTGAAQSPYGHTKHMCEQILADASAALGLEVAALRYFNPVGAHPSSLIGEDPSGIPNNLVPRVMQAADGRLERLLVYGGDYDTPDGSAVRDYLHVMDLAEAHAAALDALSEGALSGFAPVNLGTGVGHSVLELISVAERVVGAAIPHEIVGRRPGDVERIWADPTFAAEALGWRAERDLPQMLADHWNFQRRS